MKGKGSVNVSVGVSRVNSQHGQLSVDMLTVDSGWLSVDVYSR